MYLISTAMILLPLLLCCGARGHINFTLDTDTAAVAALPPCLDPLRPIDVSAGCVINSTTISTAENITTNDICITCPGANAARSEEIVLADLKTIVNEHQNTWNADAKLFIRFHSTATTLQSLDDLEPQIDKNLNAVVYVFDNGTDAIYRPKMHEHGDAQVNAITSSTTDAASVLNSRALIENDNIMAASSSSDPEEDEEDHSVDSTMAQPPHVSHAITSVGDHEKEDHDDEYDSVVVDDSVTPDTMLAKLRMEAAADMSATTTTTTTTEIPLRFAPRDISQTVETHEKTFPNGTVTFNQTQSRNVSQTTTTGGGNNNMPASFVTLVFALILSSLFPSQL